MVTNTVPTTDPNAAAAAARGFRPELKTQAGEHPVFDGRVTCETCEGTGGAGSLMGPCRLCNGTGAITPGPYVPVESRRACGISILDSAEEPTAVTYRDLPAVAA